MDTFRGCDIYSTVYIGGEGCGVWGEGCGVGWGGGGHISNKYKSGGAEVQARYLGVVYNEVWFCWLL